MDCRRIEKLIPLYVECDLESDEAGAVFAHLETCESCVTLVAEYEASQSWLRSRAMPDFDDAMLDDLRRGVMLEIDATRERPSFFGFFARLLTPNRALAAMAALLIVFAAFALYIYLGKSSAVSTDSAVARETFEPEGTSATKDVKQASGADPVTPHHRAKRRATAKNMTGERQKPDRAIMPETDNTVAQNTPIELQDVPTETEEMTRIEIQTGDPNIRIIWFSPKESDSQLLNTLLETD